MGAAGIIVEYNPLHSGHLRLLEAGRAALGPDTAMVCVMSGNFVQRGDFALLRKHARARAAVESGADLVLELPLPWAVSSAEGFAAGGVQALAATGVVEHLLFGSECGDVSALERVAAALLAPVLPRPAPRGAAWSGELCRCPAAGADRPAAGGGRRPAGVSQQHFGHRVLQGPAGAERPPPAGDHPEGGQRPRRRPGAGHPTPRPPASGRCCGRGNGRRPCPCCLRPWPRL